MNILEAMKTQAAKTVEDKEEKACLLYQESTGAEGVGFAGNTASPFAGMHPLQQGYVPGVSPVRDIDNDGIPDYMDYHFGQGQF